MSSKVITFFKSLSTKGSKKKNKTEEKPKNDIIDGKEAQKTKDKPIVKTSSVKTSKSETSKKQLPSTSKKIELVGDYLKGDDNQKKESTPVKPIRSESKSPAKKLVSKESTAKKTDFKIVTNEDIGHQKRMNTTLDTIKEMNVSNEELKNEIIVKSGADLLSGNMKVEDQTPIGLKDMQTSIGSEVKKSNSYKSLQKQAIDWKALPISSFQSTSNVSGFVPIKDIDLKTAKCIICLHLVSTQIHLTICSHIFCDHCLKSWLKHSQHCPQCRSLISSFGHSIRTEDNRICVRSTDDYKVSKVSVNADKFVDSLSAAYLFEAFLLNREHSDYLDSSIAGICGKISELEVMLSNNLNVQRNVNIKYRISEENQRLEDMRQRKKRSEESFQQICSVTDPEMIAFWQQVIALREFSDLD